MKSDETFVKLSTGVLLDPTMKPTHKIIWAYLRYRQGTNVDAYPTIDTISADLGLDRKTVLRAISEIPDTLLKTVHSTGKTTNRYVATIPANRVPQKSANGTKSGTVANSPQNGTIGTPTVPKAAPLTVPKAVPLTVPKTVFNIDTDIEPEEESFSPSHTL